MSDSSIYFRGEFPIPRPVTPEINDEGLTRGKNGYKSYSNSIAANAQKSGVQKKKERYANRALGGQRYDSDEDAEFEPDLGSPEAFHNPPARKASGSSVKEDEWAHLSQQRTAPRRSECYSNEELGETDRQSESSSNRSRKVCRNNIWSTRKKITIEMIDAKLILLD